MRRAAAGHTLGMDVSGHQGSVDWAAAWNAGARFAYTKAGLAPHFQLERSVGKLRRLYDRREK